MMVFWLAEPEEFLLNPDASEADDGELELLRAIQERMDASGFPTANIAFEPVVDWGEASQRPPSERLDVRYYQPVPRR